MGDHYKIKCNGCGTENDIEFDHDSELCRVKKLFDGIEDDVKEIRKGLKVAQAAPIAVRSFYDLIITELKKQNQLIKHYHTDPKVIESIVESCRTFMRRCNGCDFKTSGLASEMIIITHCPKCNKELGDLFEIIKPGGVPAGG